MVPSTALFEPAFFTLKLLKALSSFACPPSDGRPAGSPHPAQRLRGLKPEPSQRGQSSPSCMKHSTSTGDSGAKGATLCTSTGPPLVAVGQAPGCCQHRRGHLFSESPILAPTLLFS